MKALSIKQPWATLIALGVKDIENRTWKTAHRGKIYIHSPGHYAFDNLQKGLSHSRYNAIDFEKHADLLNGQWPKLSIIGEVDIVDCVIDHDSIWANQSDPYAVKIKEEKQMYNWVLENAVIYDRPIPKSPGKLFLWDCDLDEENPNLEK